MEKSNSLVISMLPPMGLWEGLRDRKDCGTAVGVNVGHALYVLAIFPIRGEVNGGLLTLGGRLYGRRIWEVEDLRPLGSWVKRGNTNPLAL